MQKIFPHGVRLRGDDREACPGRGLPEQKQLCGLVAEFFQAGQDVLRLHGREHAAVFSTRRHPARVAGRVHFVRHSLPEGARRLGRAVYARVGRGLAQHPVDAVGNEFRLVGIAVAAVHAAVFYLAADAGQRGRYLIQRLARLVGDGDVSLLCAGVHTRQRAHGVCKFSLGKIADDEPPVVFIVHGLPRSHAARPQRQRQQKQRQLCALLPGCF